MTKNKINTIENRPTTYPIKFLVGVNVSGAPTKDSIISSINVEYPNAKTWTIEALSKLAKLCSPTNMNVKYFKCLKPKKTRTANNIA